MPASSSDTVSQIEESLKNSLGKGDSIDNKLICSSKKILLQKVDFRPAEKQSSFQLEQLRAKYTPLNSSDKSSAVEEKKIDVDPKKPHGEIISGMNGNKEVGDGLPAPARVLYPPDRLKLEWQSVRRMGSGLHNPANTCFVNSTLQCLTYTPPLANYLCSEQHKRTCAASDFCLLCELQKHVRRCFSEPRPFEPTNIIRKLKLIAKHLQYGRQEDAHEFLRYVVEGMQKSCLYGCPKLDRYSRETTVINQIFGGYLRSQVLCLRCKARSNTFDPLLDISLDIKNVPNIQKALEKFVTPEKLDEDNAYNCPKCKQKVPAQKRFSIHRTPNVLTIQLKRFDLNRLHGKVTRHIQFPEKLDMRPYMSIRQAEPLIYHLYGVLVHSGFSAQHGHYYSYVRGSNMTWYSMNDTCVNQVNINRVLNAEAYLLFYIRHKQTPNMINNRKLVEQTSNTFSQKTNHIIGPRYPPNHVTAPHTTTKLSNGPVGRPVNDMGTPLSRKPSTSPVTGGLPAKQHLGQPAIRPSTIPNLGQRDKVSFGIKPKDGKSPAMGEKPRIVMHIRNGKVDYNSVTDKQKAAASAAAGASVIISPGAKGKLQRLVPYNGESSDSDTESSQASRGQGQSQPDHRTPSKPKQTDWSEKNGNKSISPEKNPVAKKLFEPILDHRLNATTHVPGAYGPLNRDHHAAPPSFSKSEHRRSVDGATPSEATPSARTLRRSFSDTPGLTVCTEPPKVNATTRWNVLGVDPHVSPSMGSACSSSGSVGSTSGWRVTSEKKHKPVTPSAEAQHSGWTVTPGRSSPIHKVSSEPCQGSGSQKEQPDVALKGKSSAEDTGAKHHKPVVKNSTEFTNGGSEILTNGHHANKNSVPLVNGHAHHNGHSQSSERVDNGETLNDIWDKKHKKDKKKKKKKHKKTKYEEDSDDSSERSHKKKKKKKKRREEEQPLLDTDSDSTPPHKHRKRRGSDESQTERKRHKFENEDSADYVWVEKTKETIEKAQQKNKEVPVQDWDHHTQAGHRQKDDEHATASKKSSSAAAWDGSRSNNTDVVKELKKMAARGYGAQVSAWDGGSSHVDQELSWEKQRDRKRDWEDEYDEDLDSGKVKKVKHHYDASQSTNSHKHNSFQTVQDSRNADKDIWKHANDHYSLDTRGDSQGHHGGFGRDRSSVYSPDRERDRPSWASPEKSSLSHHHHRHQHHTSQQGYHRGDHHSNTKHSFHSRHH